jgi:hypothetical protein
VKTQFGVTTFLLASVLCGAQAEPKRISAWHYPDDRMAIRSQEPPKPYKATGLPDGTVSVLTKYRQRGLRVRRPGGVGFWEFERVAKLYYHGKLETDQGLRVFGYLIGQKLQGNKSVEAYVLSLVDHAHPAATEFLNDTVV